MLGLFDLYREKKEMVKTVTGAVSIYIFICAVICVLATDKRNTIPPNIPEIEALLFKIYLWLNGVYAAILSLTALFYFNNKVKAISWLAVAGIIATTNLMVYGFSVNYLRTH